MPEREPPPEQKPPDQKEGPKTETRKTQKLDALDEARAHPRFKEWMEECKIIADAARHFNDPSIRPPSFQLWLRLKEEEKEWERKRPRVRSDNPPRGNVEAAESLFNRIFRPGWIEELLKPFPLYVYNTEFTLLLADKSTLKTTVHFQIPNHQQVLIEQLNRVTEKELLIFTGSKAKPPSVSELENHLHLSLVQFQNENVVAVLRVEICANIHLPKPNQSGELYV